MTIMPNHPVYIPTKGRYGSMYTSKALTKIGMPHYLVVEEQERALYEAVASPLARILVLDPEYQRNYETCDDLGNSVCVGPGAARNFLWDHSISIGAKWHWTMDDNIRVFYRFQDNRKIPMGSHAFLRAMEDYCDRFQNLGMAGPQYAMFVTRKKGYQRVIWNTRIFSCNLIRNDIPFRWRSRFNDDVILSLDLLCGKWCVVLFNQFLQQKINTQKVKGGLTELYQQQGTLKKSLSVVSQYPQFSRVVWRYGRWHHHVDYEAAANGLRPILKPGLDIKTGADEYGMELVDLTHSGEE